MEDDYLQENVGYAFLTTQEAISLNSATLL